MYGRSTQAPYRCFIATDKHAYYPGDAVICKVELDLDRRLSCEQVTAVFTGEAQVKWTDKQLATGSTSQTTLALYPSYAKKISLFEQSRAIWAASSTGRKRQTSLSEILRNSSSNRIRTGSMYTGGLPDFRGLEAGKHVLPVRFVIPKEDVYSSLETEHEFVSIRYKIEILLDGQITKKFNQVLPIIVPRDLRYEVEQLGNPVSAERVIQNNKGVLKAVLTLPKTGFTPGEPLEAKVTVQNGTSDSVKYASVYIVKAIRAVAEKHFKDREDETNGSIFPFPKIPRGEMKEWTAQLYVPSLTPTLAVEHFIHVNYIARLSVGFERGKRKNAVLHISIPITIGTVSIDSTDEAEALPEKTQFSAQLAHDAGVKDFSDARPRLPSAPPLYEEAIGSHSTSLYPALDDRPVPYSELAHP